MKIGLQTELDKRPVKEGPDHTVWFHMQVKGLTLVINLILLAYACAKLNSKDAKTVCPMYGCKEGQDRLVGGVHLQSASL